MTAVFANALAPPPNNATAYSFYGQNGEIFNNETIKTNSNVIAFASSDRKFKDNIVVIDNPLTRIKKISGVFFDWNDDR
ncbi:MAG TPA: hypothetical protein DCM40_20825, partial [Maribacter sp.]|nr:hypothetical protein [Maribacter sp.]